MRLLLLLLVVFAGVAETGTPAMAESYPWCSEFADGAGANCGFTTYEQCMATARGSGGYCAENVMYSPPVAAARSRHPTRNRRFHKNETPDFIGAG
jgi:Protein of unknown function (DUF3551)